MSTEIKCTCPSGDGSLRWPCPAHQPTLMTSACAATAVQPVLASDLVFGYPRELFRLTHVGDVVVSEGVSTTDAARAFWDAVAQMRTRLDAAGLKELSGNSGQLQQAGAVAGLNEPFGDSEQLAQPDAGSGGDAHVPVLRALRAILNESGRSSPARNAALDAAIAALAARQPVGENPAWRDELVREAYNRGLVEGLNADRQPVGVEPFELRICEVRHTVLKPNKPYIFTIDPNCKACRAQAAYAIGEISAAPPAPAAVPVDLSKFRDAVLHAYILATYARFKSQLGELWDLIDTHPQPAAAGDVMFGRIIEADFSTNTLLLEMEPGYRAFAGRVAVSADRSQPAAAKEQGDA